MITPISTTLEITSRCNLKCKYCFAESGGNRICEISYDDIVKTIDSLIEIGAKNFLIMGGEPTLHKDFLRVIHYIKKKNANVGFSTNGLKLSDSFCKQLVEAGVRHNVYVSIDTVTPNTYKEITGRDRFVDVVEGLDNLKKNNISYALSCVVIKQNINSLNDIYNFACLHDAAFLNLIRFNVEGRGIMSKEYLGVHFDLFNKKSGELISQYGGFRGFWGENCIIPINERIKSHIQLPAENDLRQYLTIRANGEIYLGRASGGIVIGNLFENDIVDIWHSESATRYFTMSSVDFNSLILSNIRTQNIGLL